MTTLDSPSRLEPTIKHLFHSLQISLALLGRDGDVVNVLSMQVFDSGDTGLLLEFGDRVDADDLRYGHPIVSSAVEDRLY